MSAVESTPQVMQWHGPQWEFRIDGLAKPQQITVGWIANDRNPDMLILPGLGEGRGVLEGVVSYLGDQGLRVAGVDVQYPDFSKVQRRSDAMIRAILETMMLGALPEAVQDIRRVTQQPDKRYHLVGISAGSANAVEGARLAARTGLGLYAALALVNPPIKPVSGTMIDPTNKERNANLRGILNDATENINLEALDFLDQLEGNTVTASPWSIPDLELRIDALTSAEFAFRQDAREHIWELRELHPYPIQIYSGWNDAVVPTGGIRYQLGPELGRLIEEIPGRHGLLAAGCGREQIAIAAAWAAAQSTEPLPA